MLPKLFMNEFYTNIANTLISVIILSLIYIISYTIYARKLHATKDKQRFKIRLFYWISSVFIFIVAKIWVEGFTHLIAVLSLVSAALVLSNKELVMNLVGWLIINWRDVFSEGDYIQIQEHSGYVYELGVLNFKLFEASRTSSHRASGRSIKVPNGLVINHPIINYSKQTNLIEYHQAWLLTYHTDLEKAKALMISIVKSVLQKFYESSKEYSTEWLKRRNRMLSKLIDFDVHALLEVNSVEPYGIKLEISYYCYPKDHDEIDKMIKDAVFNQMKKNRSVHLLLPELSMQPG